MVQGLHTATTRAGTVVHGPVRAHRHARPAGKVSGTGPIPVVWVDVGHSGLSPAPEVKGLRYLLVRPPTPTVLVVVSPNISSGPVSSGDERDKVSLQGVREEEVLREGRRSLYKESWK